MPEEKDLFAPPTEEELFAAPTEEELASDLLPEIPATDSDIPEQIAGSIGAFAESIRPPEFLAKPIEEGAVRAASFLTGGDPEAELERREQERAMRKAEYPIASTLGEMSGDVITPFSKAKGLVGAGLRTGQAALMGAAHGDTLEEAGEIGGIAAGATAALEALGPLGKLASKITQPIAKKVSDKAASAAIKSLGDEGQKLYELDKTRAIKLGHYLVNNNLIKKGAIKKLGKLDRDAKAINNRIDTVYNALSTKGAGINRSDLSSRLLEKSSQIKADTGLKQLGKAFKDQGDTIKEEMTKSANHYKSLKARLDKKTEELAKLREKAVSTKTTETDVLTDVNRLTRSEVDKLGISDTYAIKSTKGKTLSGRLQKSQESLTDTSKALGDITSKESIKTSSTVKDIAATEKRLMSEVDDLTNQSEVILANIDSLDTKMPLSKLRSMRSEVDKLARDSRDPHMERVGNFLRELEDDMALQAEKAVGAASGLAKRLKGEYRDVKEVERLVKGQPKEKADAIMGTATRAGVYGAAKGDLLSTASAGGIAAADFLIKHKDKFIASNLSGVVKIIKGKTKWAELFKGAMEKSGQSGIASAHYQLMQTDEDYRKAVKKQKENN